MSVREHLARGWLVLVLAASFGGALAAVHVGLAERIEDNRRAETLGQVPALLLPAERVEGGRVEVAGDAVRVVRPDGAATAELRVEELEAGGHRVLRVTGEDGTPLGWVAHGRGAGYADTIELLVGLDPALERITGLYVLAQRETPALGDQIVASWFRERLTGAPADRPLAAVRNAAEAAADPARIEAITAATVSSQSVCEIVNRTLADVRPALADRPRAPSRDAGPTEAP